MKRSKTVLTAGLIVVATALGALAHCQIPCGIYNDEARFTLMEEHVTTIEKSIKLIRELGAAKEKNANQIVRWVNNKEQHAAELTEIVTDYFLAQRVKAPDPKDAAKLQAYQAQLGQLHQVIVQAMKAKQTTDLTHVKALRALIADFKASYLK